MTVFERFSPGTVHSNPLHVLKERNKSGLSRQKDIDRYQNYSMGFEVKVDKHLSSLVMTCYYLRYQKIHTPVMYTYVIEFPKRLAT